MGGMGQHRFLLSSVVVATAADVAVPDRRAFRWLPLAVGLVEAMLEDRGDGAVAVSADVVAAPAGGIEPLDAISLGEPQIPWRAAECRGRRLLWYRNGHLDHIEASIENRRARQVLCNLMRDIGVGGEHIRADAGQYFACGGKPVMAWSVDRLGRSLQDLCGFLSELHSRALTYFSTNRASTPRRPPARLCFK